MDHNQRNRQLYSDLVNECAGALFRFAFRMCNDRQLAEDLTQETFLHAWRNIDSLMDTGKSRSWIFSILRRRFCSQLRSVSRQPACIDANPDQLMNDHDHVIQYDSNDLIQTALGELNQKYKEPLLLVLMEGFSFSEAANILDLPRGTVLTRVSRGKEKLRAAINRLENPTVNQTMREIESDITRLQEKNN